MSIQQLFIIVTTTPIIELFLVKGDASAKLGGVLAIVALINALDLVDVCKTDTRISRFGNFLCNTCLANSTDPVVIELSAKALARLTQVSGTYTANLKFQLIAHEVKRAFEVLQVKNFVFIAFLIVQEVSIKQTGLLREKIFSS